VDNSISRIVDIFEFILLCMFIRMIEEKLKCINDVISNSFDVIGRLDECNSLVVRLLSLVATLRFHNELGTRKKKKTLTTNRSLQRQNDKVKGRFQKSIK